MKHTAALLLALILMLSAFAQASFDFDIVRLYSDPPTYLVETANSWDLVDEKGQLLQQNYVDDFYELKPGLYCAERDGLLGVMNDKGQWLKQPVFDDIWDFSEGLAVAILNGLYGYLDEDCNWAIEPVYEDADAFSGGLAVVKKDGLYGYLKPDGSLLGGRLFGQAKEFHAGCAFVREGGVWGLIDTQGAYIVEPAYLLGVTSYGGNWSEAEIHTPYETEPVLYGKILSDGSVIEPRFEKVGWFFDSPLARALQGGKWGYIDRSGKYVIEPTFEEPEAFDSGAAIVKLNGLYGLIDESGRYLARPQYESIYRYNKTGLYEFKTNGLYGIMDRSGSVLIEARYENISSFGHGYAPACQDGLWGLIDLNGAWVIPPAYQSIPDWNSACAIVSMDPEGWYWDVYNVIPESGLVRLPDGKMLIDIGCDDINMTYDDGSIRVTRGGETVSYMLENGELKPLTVVGASLDLDAYRPNEGSKVVTLDRESRLDWNSAYPYPRLDGATALLPTYAALAQAVYPESLRYQKADKGTDPLFTCTKTIKAYERLTAGQTDVIFCAGPSDEEVIAAALQGVEFDYTLIGYEAFVFIVSADNPLSDITLEQIKQIYSGEVTSWDALGQSGLGDILAYQRPANSGSQTALERLMGNTPIMQAPEYVVDGMTGIVNNIEFRALPNAIGYSFRFFVTGMMESGVKLLAINGVKPSVENIQNGTYPLITPVYAVSRKGEANPNVRLFLDWITGPEGQELVEKSGYVKR